MPFPARKHKFIIYFCETKFKGIKKTLKILRISVALITIIFATIPILLQSSKIQDVVTHTIIHELSNKLHTQVSVGKIEYKLFNEIAIHNLYVEDQQQDTLLFTKQASARFNFWKFFRGKILFTSVVFNELNANLVVDSTGHSNLDFVIQAFKKPQKTDSTNIEYHIKHFELVNSSFAYTNYKNYKEVRQHVLNANKLKFKSINTDISLNVFKRDTLSAEIISFNAIEKSGLIIKNLATKIYGSNNGLTIPEFDLQLPASRLHLEDVSLKLDSLADLKNIVEKVRWNAPISNSYVTLDDLKAIIPEFKNSKGIATLKGLITGRISSMKFKKLEVKYGKSFLFNADVDINGLPNLDEAFIYGQINELHFEKSDVQDFISDLSKKPFVLPKELNLLGLVRYKGNITGFLSNLVAYGNLNTNLGSVSTDILLQFENNFQDLKYNGTIKSGGFQIGKLLANKQLGKVSFDLNTNGTKKEKKDFQGVIKAKVPLLEFNDYSYNDIQFSGKYDGNGFNGKVEVQDENINAHFNGMIDLTQKLPVFDFDLKILNTNLYALHLIKKYPGATLSFNGKTNMVGNSLDNINGFLRFDSIIFKNKNKILNIENIQLTSRIEANSSYIGVSSDIVNGAFNGNFKYSTIGETINQIVEKYLPALGAISKNTKDRLPNHIDVNLQIENTKTISEVMELPYTLEGISTLKGYIDEKSNRIELKGNIPTLRSNKLQFDNITVNCENLNKQLNLTSRAQLQESEGLINIFLLASAAKDSVKTHLGWQNNQKITNAGDIQMAALFRNESGKIATQVSVLPTQIIILDSVWNIHASKIDLNTDSTIQVHNFLFDNKKQFIQIDGKASKNQDDSLIVNMNDLNLEYILNLARLKGITIGGFVSGKVNLFNLLSQPIYEANLRVKDVKLNHKLIGNARLNSSWDKTNKQLLANGIFTNDKNETIALADGVFVPKTDSLDFMIDARNLSIEFLTPYFESVVQNVKGYGTGKIRMFGPSKFLGFEGNAFVDKGQASVKMLKTSYFFNDTVRLTRKTIKFKNVKIYDQERNQGTMNGLMTHNGIFKEMLYDVNIKARNLLAMNTKTEDNDYLFGKAYANGTVHIFGDEKEANIIVDAVSQPKTKCYINMGGASNASDNSFIKFKSKTEIKEIVIPKSITSNFNVKVDLRIDVTPDAEMELIIDPKGGDIITGKGNGNLRVEFDTFSDIKLYGTYTIDNGYYLFTLQNFIRKEFKIDQGSTISWTGDPFNAQVNIRALYPLTASLRDLLDESELSSISRTSVPVNCVLKLNESLMKPTINFDIILPSSEERVKQLVKSVINTDEMMNRQILYLLVFNKFYRPDNVASSSPTNNLGTNEAFSFAFSTFSAQINSLLSQMIKSNNFSFGIDYRQSDQISRDIQAQILYQPTNRWLVNGNFGYRNDINSTNTNRFISDVDIEYLLSEGGKIRLKGYSHTVDRYRLTNNGTTSQGFGFIYKEDFSTVDELFKYYWRILSGKPKTETNNETTTNN